MVFGAPVPVPPCLLLAEKIVPTARALAAAELVQQGWSQTKVAGYLQVSQAMVSKYCRAPPTDKSPLAIRLGRELVDDALAATAAGSSSWCKTLDIGHTSPNRGAALDDLLTAEELLRASPPVPWFPQVGMNIAVLAGNRHPDNILAYPARLQLAGGKLIAPVTPEFGASGHLANCLMAANEKFPNIGAIMNVKGGSEIAQKLATGHISGPGNRDQLFVAVVQELPEAPQFIHDEGAMGIEPCLYVLGQSAQKIVSQLLEIGGEITA